MLNNYPGRLSELITQNLFGVAVALGNPVAIADTLERLVRIALWSRKWDCVGEQWQKGNSVVLGLPINLFQ